MQTVHRQRIAQLQKLIRERGLSSLLVTDPVNWFYLTGFTGESGILAVETSGLPLLHDGRFTVQAKQEAPSLALLLQNDGLYRTCGEHLKRRNRRSVGFDADQMTVAQLGALRKVTGRAVRFEETFGLVQSLRTTKA